MHHDLTEHLCSFGLSEKESAIYLALLSFGTASASQVAKLAEQNRSTTYIHLDTLVSRGLASISTSGKKRLYTASPPEKLVQTIEHEAKEAAEKLGQIRILLPELKSIYNGVGPKPKVTFYEGAEGIEVIYEDTLLSSEEIRAFASIEDMHALLPHYFPAYYQRRANRGISIRSIHPDTPAARERIRYNKEEKRNSMVVPKSKYDFSPEINIYDNKIAFMSLQEKFGLLIESQELANAMKRIFELAWSEAKYINSKGSKNEK